MLATPNSPQTEQSINSTNGNDKIHYSPHTGAGTSPNNKSIKQKRIITSKDHYNKFRSDNKLNSTSRAGRNTTDVLKNKMGGMVH